MKEQCKTCKRLNMADEVCGVDGEPLENISPDGLCCNYDPRLVTVEEYLDLAEQEAKKAENKKILKKIQQGRKFLKVPGVGKMLRTMFEYEIAQQNMTVDKINQ